MAATACYGSTTCANGTGCLTVRGACSTTKVVGNTCTSCDASSTVCTGCCCSASGSAYATCTSNYEQNYYWVTTASTCCGDTSGDTYEYCAVHSGQSIAWTCTSSDDACCASAQCVKGGVCKAAGGQTGLNAGGNDNVANCIGITWYDCDTQGAGDSYCDAGEACYSAGARQEAYSGESSGLGEYPDMGTLACCADDTGENYRTRVCSASAPCTTDATDKGCCSASTDCEASDIVNAALCWSQGYCGNADGIFSGVASCSGGTWYDPDESSTYCGYCSGYAWNVGYGDCSITNCKTECCGNDDLGEAYKTGGIGAQTTSCCNVSTDCVENGSCRANTAYASSTCYDACGRAQCSSGTWSDQSCGELTGCSGGSCTDLCEADCSADTWTNGQSRLTCGAGGSNGCPSGSRCCIGDQDFGLISCMAYDDDYSSAVCLGYDGYTWRTDTSGDEGVDSNNCTSGVTYCGDNNKANGYCCGDDTNENYRTGGIGSPTTACCDASTDCVESGVCKTDGSNSDLCATSCAKYECSSGSWTPTSLCNGQVLCSGSSCTTTCEADCGADTWTDAQAQGACGVGGSNGCPSGSRCCAGNGTSGASCEAYDDDYSSAICATLDSKNWTTVTTGDGGTDSTDCSSGVECGDGTKSNGFCCGDDSSENWVTQGVGTGACCASGAANVCVDSGNVCRTEYSTEVSCSDGIDNDCDGNIDSADTDCVSYTPKSQNWKWYDDEWDCDSNASTHDAGQTCANSVNGSVLAAENTVATGIGKMNAIKLRITINETGGAEGTDVKMRVQYAEKVGGDCNNGDESFANVAAKAATDTPWRYYDSTAGTNDSDNTVLGANRLSDSGSNKATHNEVGDSATTFDHTASTAFEWEFSIQNYNGTANTSYCFRIYDNTNAAAVLTNTAETLPELTTASAYDLSFDAPTSAVMPDYQLGSGTAGYNSNQFTDKDISVWDTRGTGAGWALTATSNDWSSGSDTILNDDINWTTDTIKAQYAENTSCATNVGVCAGTGAFSGSVTLIDADADTDGPYEPGWGGYLIDAWTLKINNIDARKTGAYQGTISFSCT